MERSERERLHAAIHTICDALGNGHHSLRPELAPEPETIDCGEALLLIVVSPPSARPEGPALDTDERELLSRMVKAIGRDLDTDCLLVEARDVPPFSGCPGPRGIILVREEPGFGCVEGPGGAALTEIHHPARLLLDAALKRHSWENLKALAPALEGAAGPEGANAGHSDTARHS